MDQPAAESGPQSQPTRSLALALLALALGGVAIGTGEFVVMGLLPEVADGINSSLASTGHVVSAYAIGVVIGAPLIAIFGSKLPRRGMLIGLMGVYAVGNLLSAFAPGFLTLFTARLLAGLPHGAYFGIAALVGASLAGPDRRAWAVTRVMLGLSVANVVAVPIAVLLGQDIGWRSAFITVAVIALLTMLAIFLLIKPEAGHTEANVRGELSAFKKPQVWLTLGVGMIGFGGLFAVFTYISPTLTERSGLPEGAIPAVLVVWGLGMVAGNIFWGDRMDRSLVRSIYAVLTLNFIFLIVFAFASKSPVAVIPALFLVSTGVGLVSGLQTRLMDVAHEAQTLAASLNHGAFNVANALGALLAGIAVSGGHGFGSPAIVGAGLAILGIIIFTISVLTDSNLRASMQKPS